ncbi:putative quinol monooxygenase [Pseudooceanicola sp. C21-150M6]|uniref:putative quinol monooxygenase n=1 Tax=Pseudooceanicola sp. C21-150M6 TaxID=3434355 RepID=UPI003D7F8E26
MLIAHLTFTVAPDQRAMAVNTLLAEASTVRSMPGCLTFRPFALPEDATTIGVLHEWDSEEAFNAYLASDAFKNSGTTLRPLMTAPPVSKRFHAERLEVIN